MKNKFIIKFNKQPDIDKIYLYAKDPYEAKYQFLINKKESTGLKHFNDPKAFIEYSNDLHDVYKNIDDYNPDKESKILIVFDDILQIWFITDVTLNTSHFVPKDVTLNTSHFVIAKTANKRELQQIEINHSSDISTKDFQNIYVKCTAEPYSFLVNDTTLASNNPLRFRKNLFGIYNKNHDN